MDYEKLIKKQLSEKRYAHSMRVAETAIKLAEAHGADTEKAKIAGILHDYCKEYPVKEQIRIAVDAGLLSSKEDLLMPQVLHGPVAAQLLRGEGVIDDEEILQAIRFHTTGHPEMGTLAKIIFISDYIEPGRKTPHLEGLFELAEKDLDACVVEIIDRTTVYLLDGQKLIHETMIECRNRLLSKE